MSVNTADREFVRRALEIRIRRTAGGYTTRYPSCSFPGDRTFATEAGLVQRMAEHMMRAHDVRLMLHNRSPRW